MFLTRLALLNKRLFKKLGFLAILLLVPLLTFSVDLAADRESGVLKITLAAADSSDATANEIIESLCEDNTLILFSKASSEEEAVRSVKLAQSDAAWIIGPDTDRAIARFLQDKSEENAFISVYQREQTVMLSLSTEKLISAVFPKVSDDVYLHFIRQNVAELDSVSDEKLLEHYDSVFSDTDLFRFGEAGNDEGGGYLTGPIRGILSVLIILGGMAASVYFFKDEENGTFAILPLLGRRMVASLTQQSAMLWLGAASLLALYISGQFTDVFNELLCMAVYLAAAAGFCTLLRRLCPSARALSSLSVVTVVVLIAVCPVFLTQTALRPLQFLLPVFYYLTAVYDTKFILYMAVYAAAIWLLNAAVAKLTRRV